MARHKDGDNDEEEEEWEDRECRQTFWFRPEEISVPGVCIGSTLFNSPINGLLESQIDLPAYLINSSDSKRHWLTHPVTKWSGRPMDREGETGRLYVV